MRSPWWVVSLYSGVLFGIFFFLFHLLDGSSVGDSAVTASVASVFFGLLFGPMSRRMSRRMLNAMGDVSASQQREIRRATLRGPVPSDPRIRDAAVGLVDERLRTLRGMRWAPAMWLFFIALSIWLAVSDHLWWIFGALLFAYFLCLHLWTVRRLTARRVELGEPASPR